MCVCDSSPGDALRCLGSTWRPSPPISRQGLLTRDAGVPAGEPLCPPPAWQLQRRGAGLLSRRALSSPWGCPALGSAVSSWVSRSFPFRASEHSAARARAPREPPSVQEGRPSHPTPRRADTRSLTVARPGPSRLPQTQAPSFPGSGCAPVAGPPSSLSSCALCPRGMTSAGQRETRPTLWIPPTGPPI